VTPSVVANCLQITAYCLFMIAKDPVALISALFTSRFLDMFRRDLYVPNERIPSFILQSPFN